MEEGWIILERYDWSSASDGGVGFQAGEENDFVKGCSKVEQGEDV